MSAVFEISTAKSSALSYDIFISYSRKDIQFVDVLVQALERYSPPKTLELPYRRLSIFLDRHDFQAGDYQERLSRYLKESLKLVVICSPSARASRFVDEEIKTFAAFRGAQHVVPVLIAGIPNNEAASPDEQFQAFPEQLCELMRMPNAIDYRTFILRQDRADRGRFADSWFTLLAAIYDRSRAEIELREQRRRRKRRRFYSAFATLAAVFAVLLFTVALPRYRLEAALAAVSEAGGRVDEREGYVSVVLQSNAKAANVDAALAKLASLPRIYLLDLASCNVTTSGLAYLKNIHGLKQLTVANTNVTDDGMTYIGKLHSLTKLELDGTNISGRGLLSLDQLPQLKNLSLSGLKLNSTVLSRIASCRQLTTLSVAECELHDGDLSHLASLTDLQELYLSRNQIKGDGLKYLRQMHKLKTLELGDTPLTDSGLLQISSLRSLESLYLGNTQITNAGLASLAGLSALQSLVLQENEQLNDSGVRLLGSLPAIREFWIRGTSIGDGSMQYLSKQRTLRVLAAPNTRVTDAGMIFLAELPDLRELYLGGDRITDVGAQALFKIQTLRKLYLPTAQLTDKVLPQFKALPKLRELSVGGPRVTKRGFERLKSSLPNVKVLLNEAPSS